jgi:hypothetical protein
MSDGGGDGPTLAHFTAVEFHREIEDLRAKLAQAEAERDKLRDGISKALDLYAEFADVDGGEGAIGEAFELLQALTPATQPHPRGPDGDGADGGERERCAICDHESSATVCRLCEKTLGRRTAESILRRRARAPVHFETDTPDAGGNGGEGTK